MFPETPFVANPLFNFKNYPGYNVYKKYPIKGHNKWYQNPNRWRKRERQVYGVEQLQDYDYGLPMDLESFYYGDTPQEPQLVKDYKYMLENLPVQQPSTYYENPEALEDWTISPTGKTTFHKYVSPINIPPVQAEEKTFISPRTALIGAKFGGTIKGLVTGRKETSQIPRLTSSQSITSPRSPSITQQFNLKQSPSQRHSPWKRPDTSLIGLPSQETIQRQKPVSRVQVRRSGRIAGDTLPYDVVRQYADDTHRTLRDPTPEKKRKSSKKTSRSTTPEKKMTPYPKKPKKK